MSTKENEVQKLLKAAEAAIRAGKINYILITDVGGFQYTFSMSVKTNAEIEKMEPFPKKIRNPRKKSQTRLSEKIDEGPF